MRHKAEGNLPDDGSDARLERLLSAAQGAAALRHKLAMLDIEAKHRLSWYRSHFNPDQPRVPAGHHDGGQWTKEGGGIGIRVAANEKQPLSPNIFSLIFGAAAKRAIEHYRDTHSLWDLLKFRDGTVSLTTIDGKDIFGSNSDSPTYSSVDRAAAIRMRDVLSQKYPDIVDPDNIGKMPANSIFHAETTVLLRAARANGGTLAGRTLHVFVDAKVCNNCKPVLPKVGLELGNPTVIFHDTTRRNLTMRDGKWLLKEE